MNISELRRFKCVTTSVLVLKKIEREDKTNYDTFYSYWKGETIINESDIDDNVFTSYKRYKNFQEKVHAGLLIQL